MKDPCEMCEVWMADTPCENDDCPVEKLKKDNKRLKVMVERHKYENSWDFDINTGSYMGRW